MKKTHTILAITAGLIVTLTSCTNPLMKDPRLYNKKQDLANSVPAPTEEPEIEAPQGFTPFDLLNEWYNNPDTNGDANNPTAVGFSNKEFDKMSITGWFSNQNVPTYTMKSGDVWGSCTDSVRNEFIHSGAPNTEGQGFKITGVTYFQYRGKNPCYAGDGGYNKSYQKSANGNPMLERFYFYRFTGKGGGVQWLDNFLIAIDTYSKLVFAFAEPTKFSSMGAPTEWAATDKDKFNGAVYPFYMYDPVGYVLKNDNGSYSVELYKWFQDRLAAGNYKGSINKDFIGKIASKSPDGAGSSPFLSEVTPAEVPFLEKVKERTFAARENYNNINANWKDDGQGYGERLIEYKFSKDGKSLEIITTPLKGEKSIIKATTDADLTKTNDVIYTIAENNTIKITVGDTGDSSQDVAFITTDEDSTRKYINNFKDNGPAFKFRVAGKTFSSRQADGYTGNDGHGYGMLLYEYKFDETGTEVTKITTRWGKEPKEEGKFKLTDSAPMSSFDGSEILTVNKDSNIISSDKGINYYSNFNDMGPSFKNRVRQSPKYTGECTYTFINGYKKLKVDDITYTFERFEPEYNRAVYWKQDIFGTYFFYGIELSNENYDNTITMTSWSGKHAILWNTLGWESTKTIEQPSKDLPSNLKSKTFSVRDDDGYGPNLYSYEFNSDGKTVTYSKTPWEGKKETWNGKYDKENNYTINNNSVTINYDPTKESITVDDMTLYNYYDDKGPAFTTKVKGKTYGFRELDGYTGNDGNGYGLNLYTYEFSKDGLSVEYTVTNWATSATSTYTYNISKGQDKSKGLADNGMIQLFVTPEGKLTSTKDSKTDIYIQDFKDLYGPSFKNRLLGHRVFGGSSFSNDSDLSTFKWDEYTYNNPRVYNDHREFLVYQGKGITKGYLYKVEVIKNKDNSVSIQMSDKKISILNEEKAKNDTNMTEPRKASDTINIIY